MKYFKLDSTSTIFRTVISQLPIESSAQHYKEDGKLTKSSKGALGIAQIMPLTAYEYLRRIMTEEDKKSILVLGCTPFNEIYSYPVLKTGEPLSPKANKFITNWLSIEKNNLIFWGFLMNRLIIGKNYTLPEAFIAYNGGEGLADTYRRNGKNPKDNVYYRLIVNDVKINSSNMGSLR